jgi:hypothetical protein
LLVKVICTLFTKNTENRPDFKQLYNFLAPFEVRIQRFEGFEFNKDYAAKKHQTSPQKYLKPIEFDSVESVRQPT